MNLDVINGFIATLTNRELWLRLGIGALGVSMISVGLIMVIAGDKQVTDAVGSAAEIGLSKTPVGAAAVATKTVLEK